VIAGVGTDMTEISRIARAVGNPRLMDRLFTQKEQALWRARGENAAVLAGCFAAKEAVVKALGTGFTGFWPNEIEILRGDKGEPFAVLHGKANEIAGERGIERLHVSITNTEAYAFAFAVAERV